MVCRRYEDLRAAVLGGRDAGWRHGWAVLARAGMVAWTKAVAVIGEGIPAIGNPAGPDPEATATDTGGDAELVHVLAALVLGKLRPP